MIDFEVAPGEHVMVPTGLIFVPSEVKLPPPLSIAANVTARTSTGREGLSPRARIFDQAFLMRPEDDPEEKGWVICLGNVSNKTISKKVGERVAQLHFIVSYCPALLRISKETLASKKPTERGARGFGQFTGL